MGGAPVAHGASALRRRGHGATGTIASKRARRSTPPVQPGDTPPRHHPRADSSASTFRWDTRSTWPSARISAEDMSVLITSLFARRGGAHGARAARRLPRGVPAGDGGVRPRILPRFAAHRRPARSASTSVGLTVRLPSGADAAGLSRRSPAISTSTSAPAKYHFVLADRAGVVAARRRRPRPHAHAALPPAAGQAHVAPRTAARRGRTVCSSRRTCRSR